MRGLFIRVDRRMPPGCRSKNRRRVHLGMGAITCIVWLASVVAGHAQLVESLATRESRREAINAIPFQDLKPETQAQLKSVINDATLYRKLPVKTIDCDPELYIFLVRNPEVVVNMWQLMGITQVRCKRLGPYSFEGSDGAGTISRVDLVYGTRNLHVFYADGHYEGPLLKRMTHGRAVMVLSSDYSSTADQRSRVTSRLDMFVQLENVGADFVGKTLQPLVGKVADSNFVETVNFVGQVGTAAEKKGDGVHLLAKKMTNIDSDVRDKFIEVTMAVYERAKQSSAAVADANGIAPTLVPIRNAQDDNASSPPSRGPVSGIRVRR